MKRTLRIAVIGAGMSGILAAIKLREAGHTQVTLFEKADRLGGTWRDNRYPGLSCDVPSHHYAYSFAMNPEWSHLFSPGPEILAYFEDVAARYGLLPLIRFGEAVERARFVAGEWELTTHRGTSHFDVVIAATGVLHHPVLPEIPGRESFAGPAFHTARWDANVSLEGRRVGIIGTGSTAIQIVPAIQPEVAEVVLFQRTAQWVLPFPNPAYTEEERAEFRQSPQRMHETYAFWAKRFQNTFARAVVGDEAQLQRIADLCESNLARVQDPLLRQRLTPDYRVACKRLIMSDTFYDAIQQPNAKLVTEAIEGIEPEGVRTRDGELHPLDVLVYATGFDGHAFMRPMVIEGEDGVSLEDAWAEGNRAYRSVALPGFPNFFMLVGPNSPIGNFSLILIAEMQVAYILQLVARLAAGECRTLAPSAEATQRFNDALEEAMGRTVWVSGCRSWYIDRHGRPAMWPWSFERFEREMRRPEPADFTLAS
jgi:cation diffusion facilitator CzcD-associated flavoprotein CzcO